MYYRTYGIVRKFIMKKIRKFQKTCRNSVVLEKERSDVVEYTCTFHLLGHELKTESDDLRA